MRLTAWPVLGAMVLSLAPRPDAAQTSGKPASPSRLLAEYSSAMEELAQSASPAVVKILTQKLTQVGKGESQDTGFVSEQEVSGSGVIVDAGGYIVTNAHVVQNARSIEVKIIRSDERGQEPHGHLVPARLIGVDPEVDIAVLKIEGEKFPTLSFMDSDKLRQGQLVVALGSPLGLQNSFTHGVISATFREVKADSPVAYIQTDAPINPGNSGGPLVDIEGHIAGINTMILSESGGNEGIGFAVPANLAKDVYLRLRHDGRIRRGAIGVIPETITPTMAAALGLDRDWGVILSDVFPHCPADVADVRIGDVVLSIDGKPMREARDLAMALFQRSPGDELSMEIERGHVRMTKRVALLERNSRPSQLEELADYDSALVRQLGILALAVDGRVTEILPSLRHASGVAVAAVPAEYAGLNPGLAAGDVIYSLNDKPLRSLGELRDALKDKKSGDPMVFLVERLGQLIYVTATLD